MLLEEANDYLETPNYLFGIIFRTLGLKPGEVFFNLGSRDGKLLEEAYRRGAKAVGVEINPKWVKVSRKRLPNCIKIIEGDALKTDLNYANCIYMFLDVNTTNEVGYRIIKECKVGTRIASLVFPMFDFEPVKSIYIGDIIEERFKKAILYLYKTPLKLSHSPYTKVTDINRPLLH